MSTFNQTNAVKSRQFLRLLLFVLLTHSSYAQMLPSATLSFEKLEWGQTIEKVTEILQRKLTEAPDDDFNPFSRKSSGGVKLFYEDTVWTQKVGVGLLFSKEKNELIAVSLVYFPLDPKTKREIPDAEKQIEFLWQKLSERYGKPQKESNIPFMGKARRWSFPKTDVKLMSITSKKAKMLIVTYSPKEK